jgi:hypothetical protein
MADLTDSDDGFNSSDWYSNPKDDKIIEEAKDNFKACIEWEARARILFDDDYKFANGDSDNLFQWPNEIVTNRRTEAKPILTINKTRQHNLNIINDAKQNKPGVNIRPVGEDASFEAAQIFQEIVRHIEYISNAESVYDNASTFQIEAGIGYWRLIVDYISDTSFDQEIFIRRIKDPRQVYLDPYINEVDGSDANFGFIFEDIPKKIFKKKYPKYAHMVGQNTFTENGDGWISRETIRIAEYYRRTQDRDSLVTFIIPEEYGPELAGQQVISRLSELDSDMKSLFKEIKKRESNIPLSERTWQERDIITQNVEWFKIAGNIIIERGPWLGKFIPIIRVIGTETVIDGILDRKGHTRDLKDAQRMYNYNTSANIEFGALQTKAPWIAATASIEGYEEYYKSANITNLSYLPFNAIDDAGNPLPAPSRPQPPQASPAYVQGMQISQNEMMMVSGQYQAQMGENENAKSGVAINARQRQGDRATYHFIDGLAMAIRNTGKQLIDLIPKIYDTQRVLRISASNGSILDVTINPDHDKPFEKIVDQNQQPETDKAEQITKIIFNPNIGTYDVQSDTGPSFATRRQEAFNALTQIAAQNKDFMNIAGDILWKVADFPEAQVLAERWRKIIPPNVIGDAPNPQVEKAMHDAADKIEQQLSIIAKQAKELADKDRDLDIKEREIRLKEMEAEAIQSRLDYEAENKRLAAVGNAGPIVTAEQIQPVLKQLLESMLIAGAPNKMPAQEDLDAIRNAVPTDPIDQPLDQDQDQEQQPQPQPQEA